MTDLRSRPRAAALRAHACLSAALLCCFALSLPASAQDAAPNQEAIKLPEVLIEQPAVAAPAKKGAKKSAKKSPSAPAPVQPAPPVVDLASEQTGGNVLANPGTPAAGVVPIFGKAGSPAAQTATGIDTAKLDNEPLFSVNDLLRQSPGVSLKQGNGPRDFGISIRGSNARNGFGIRNIVIFEDGFPVTQPDGLSRSDLVDPHAYGGVDVWRGPSSAMFGNYATGGAINFRTRPGGEIDGVEYGVDVGSFNYFNNYVTAGTRGEAYEASIFMSDVRGDGHYEYSAFDTQTVNMLITYQATSQDKVTIKGINNDLYTELPFRMSLNQFNQNPFQQGCQTAVGAARGLRDEQLLGDQHQSACAADGAAGGGEPRRPPHHRRLALGARIRRRYLLASAVRHRRSQHQPADRHDERRRRLSSPTTSSPTSATGRSWPVCRPHTCSARSGTTCRSIATPTLWLRAATRPSASCSRTPAARRRTSAPAPARR